MSTAAITPALQASQEIPAGSQLIPRLRQFLDLREPWLGPLLLLLTTRIWFWRLLPFASEDAYITYRYARNLVGGFGLTYNPGEHVMGFSTPVWTLWNALGYALMRDPLAWSRATTLGLECIALLVAGSMLARQCGRASAWIFTAFYAAWPYLAAVAMSGMENSAMLAGIVLTAALVERRHLLAGPAIAAVALLRPEGLLVGAILGLGASRRDRLVAVALLAAGIGALWAYFGSPIPQSVVAKASLYGTPGPWAGRHWWEWAFPAPLGAWPSTSEGGVLFAMAVVAAPAMVLGLRPLWSLRGTAVGGAFGAMLGVWVVYVFSGAAWFWWYLSIPLGGALGLISIGLPHLARSRLLYASLAVFVAGAWTIVPGLYGTRANVEWQTFGGTAEFLAANSKPGQHVLLEPIGMVGWRCDLIVLDEIGLVSPAVATRRLQGPGWMSDVLGRERPEWFVVRRGVMRDLSAFAGRGEPFRSVAERDTVASRYPMLATIGDPADASAIEIRKRRDVVLARGVVPATVVPISPAP